MLKIIGRPLLILRWIRLNLLRPIRLSIRVMIREVLKVYRGGGKSSKRKRSLSSAFVVNDYTQDKYTVGDDGEIRSTKTTHSQL